MLDRATVAVTLTAVLGGAAAASPGITGFVAPAGQLSGQVTDHTDAPLAGVIVHIASKAGGDRTVTTDKEGRYRAEIAGGDAFVFAEGDVHLRGQVVVTGMSGSNEVIQVREAVAPPVMPKPITSSAIIPEYSEAASSVDTWTRAWLLLDVGEDGKVQHLKLINRPGLDLDRIAIRDGFKLKFQPARDRSNRPTRALMLWTFEWPSWRWMSAHDLPFETLPEAATHVPCKIEGSTRSHYRDCSKPDMVNAATLPWLDPVAGGR